MLRIILVLLCSLQLAAAQNKKVLFVIADGIPASELEKATGCSIDALKKIVNKSEGAYFSSGSRPNQTAQSWGYARLASAITGGKSAAVDYKIIDLTNEEFDDFISYLNVSDEFLINSSQYEFLIFVKDRFIDYQVARRNNRPMRTDDFNYDKD